MNKLFTKIATLSVGLFMAIGVGVAVGSKSAKAANAEDVVYKTALFGNGYNPTNSGYQGSFDATNDSFTVTATYFNNNNNGWTNSDGLGQIKCGRKNVASVGVISTKDAIDKAITKVALRIDALTVSKINSIKLYSSSNNSTWSEEGAFTAATGTKEVSISSPTADLYYKIEFDCASGSSNGLITISKIDFYKAGDDHGTLESIEVTGSMTKTSYLVGEDWSAAGLTATGHYDSGYSSDITSEVAWSFNPASPALNVSSVVATATVGTVSGNSSAQAVSVTKANPIQVLYTKASGASVDVYGYYVGFLDGTGPVIMDGEYGIVIYDKTADVSGYTEKETILHVTGSISIFKGLYEIGSASISVASGTYDAPSAPVVYATAGGETADYASRLTTVTGTPSLVSGSFDDAAGTADITMNFDIGLSNPIQVFYKKAAQTADATAFANIKAAVADSEEITIKGFTSWYNAFQVQMKGVVEAKEDYTAEDFAEDLLAQTDAVCKDWEEGVNNHDAIEAIWSDLASDDKYPSLPADQKAILASAARNPSGTTVEQAMARYDFLTGKYKLSNFINGRTPVGMNNYVTPITEGDNNTAIIVIVSISAISVLSIAVLLTLKKRKLR